MKKDDIDVLRSFTYGDLVAQSMEHLYRIRESYQEMDLNGEVPPDFPTHVQVQTIGGCNAACVMCPMSSPEIRQLQPGRISQELFRQIVSECARHESCKVISPYLQNEPLLDIHLAERVRLIKTLSNGRLAARIVTNGSLLTSERAGELLAAGLDVISISLNAHTKEVYEQVMPGLVFEKTLQNIESLLDRDLTGVLLILTFMVTALNEQEIREAIDYWSERGVMCGAFGIGTMTGTLPNFDLVKGRSNLVERPKECFAPIETATLLSNGELLLCCADWARAASYGNIGATSIREVWHSKPLSRIRRDAIFQRFEHPICTKCLGQTKTPQNLLYEGGPGRLYRA